MATGNFFNSGSTVTVNLDNVKQVDTKSSAAGFSSGNLIYDKTEGKFYSVANGAWSVKTFGDSQISTLNDIPDVVTAGVTDGQILTYDGVVGQWGVSNLDAGSGSSTLAALTDVTIVTPQDNDVLYYDASTTTWRRTPITTLETYSSVSDLTAVLGDMAAKSTVSTSDFSDFAGDVKDVTEAIDFNAQTSTSYTLALSDAGKLVSFDNASAVTVTIPAESSVAWDTGTVIGLLQENSGTVSVTPASGVTIRSKNDARDINGKWATAALTYLDSDVWLFSGDITSTTWYVAQSAYYNTVVPTDAEADYFVDFDSGSDASDGTTWAKAKLTLQSAAALLQGTGGVVKVRGTHSGSQVEVTADGISSQYIEFWADSLYNAKVNGAGFDNAVNLYGDYQAVYGMEVYGSNYTGFRDSSSYVGKKIKYCYGHDPVWADAGSGGGALASLNAQGATVESSLAVGGTPGGGDAFATTLHGIYLKQGIARNNLVVNIRGGYGIHIWDSVNISGTEATNNTCLYCNAGGLVIKGTNLVAANNIVAYNDASSGSGNGLGLRVYGPATGGLVTHNLYWQNVGSDFLDSSSASITNDNPVTADPSFVNYQSDGSGDYRVTSAGAAYQAASSTHAPTLDFYGNTRADSPTIGYHEVE